MSLRAAYGHYDSQHMRPELLKRQHDTKVGERIARTSLDGGDATLRIEQTNDIFVFNNPRISSFNNPLITINPSTHLGAPSLRTFVADLVDESIELRFR